MSVVLLNATPALGDVTLNVMRVGFPALFRGTVVRSGAWIPVIVEVGLVYQSSFDGTIRVGQLDGDGDECYQRVDIHLGEPPADHRRLTLYVLANPSGGRHRYVVELFDQAGDAVEVVSFGERALQAEPSQSPDVLAPDALLILSLSDRPVGRLADLERAQGTVSYRRPVHVAHMQPSDLPPLWPGLEAVDVIVWDDAKPEALSLVQVEALAEWVRQGGTLLLAASTAAAAIRLSEPLRDLIPVTLGSVGMVENLPVLRKALLTPTRAQADEDALPEDWWRTPLPSPIPLVDVTLHDGATPIPSDVQSDGEGVVVVRGRAGRGEVIFSAVTLQDLFSGQGSAASFFDRVLHLDTLSQTNGSIRAVTLFPHVVSAVGFTEWGVSYLLAAGFFSLLYVAAATLGTWSLLSAKGWRQHSWTAFAVVAAGASLLSVFAVNFIRGFGKEVLHQVSIVDAASGSTAARATTFFGLKTGIDKTLDLWLPDDPVAATEPEPTPCFLRPLPVGGMSATATGSFADPTDYRLQVSSAVIDDVRIRATLKRFEGRWSGYLNGMVEGEISIKDSEVVEGSYLVNRLGVDLRDCYLLHARVSLDQSTGPRSRGIDAYPLGTLTADGGRVDLAALCNPPVPQAAANSSTPRQRPQLLDAQEMWRLPFGSVLGQGYGALSEQRVIGQEKNALLLLSTAGDYDPQDHAGLGASVMGVTMWSRDRLRQMDLRHQLTRDSVTLVGFADDPGPVRLFRRVKERPYRPLEPDPRKSWTLYRIRLPAMVVASDDEDREESVR